MESVDEALEWVDRISKAMPRVAPHTPEYVLAAEVRRLRAERDELRAHGKGLPCRADRPMNEDEKCQNYECPYFDMDLEQNCSGADQYEGPIAETCREWIVPCEAIQRLRAERDELRAALSSAIDMLKKIAPPLAISGFDGMDDPTGAHDVICKARAVLSRTEGGEVVG